MGYRTPFVAGSFYPEEKKDLEEQMKFFKKNCRTAEKEEIKAMVIPHAGHIYSGRTAAYGYAALKNSIAKKNPLFIIVSPNHTGKGAKAAVSTDHWVTPLGIVKTDREFAKKMVAGGVYLEEDEEAHKSEHSIEVQLPFLQSYFKEPEIVGVTLLNQEYETAVDVAQSAMDAERETGRNAVMIASSDFSHYGPAKESMKADMECIKRILALDARGFLEKRICEKSSSCGFGPIAAAIEFAKRKGARRGKLLDFSNSGQVVKGKDEVVNYASIMMY